MIQHSLNSFLILPEPHKSIIGIFSSSESLDSILEKRSSLYGGIAPNQVIARSEFEVHRQIVTEWM